MNQTKNIATMGLWELLDYLFMTAEFPEGNGSVEKAIEGKKPVYTIKSPITRRIFNAHSTLVDEAYKMKKEHRALHQSVTTITGHSCLEYHKKIGQVTKNLDILSGLFWMAVRQEFSETNFGTSIRNGWELFDGDGDISCKESLLTGGSQSVIGSLFNSLSEIMRKDLVLIDEVEYCEIEDGEKVIGKLTDSRVRGVAALSERLNKEVVDRTAELLLLSKDKVSDETLDQALKKMSPEEVEKWVAVSKVIDNYRDVLSSIFWAGVYHTVKGSADPDTIGMRSDWQVVSVPEEDPVKVVMTPRGPAISIDLGLVSGSGLVEILRGRI